MDVTPDTNFGVGDKLKYRLVFSSGIDDSYILTVTKRNKNTFTSSVAHLDGTPAVSRFTGHPKIFVLRYYGGQEYKNKNSVGWFVEKPLGYITSYLNLYQ